MEKFERQKQTVMLRETILARTNRWRFRIGERKREAKMVLYPGRGLSIVGNFVYRDGFSTNRARLESFRFHLLSQLARLLRLGFVPRSDKDKERIATDPHLSTRRTCHVRVDWLSHRPRRDALPEADRLMTDS